MTLPRKNIPLVHGYKWLEYRYFLHAHYEPYIPSFYVTFLYLPENVIFLSLTAVFYCKFQSRSS